MLSKFLDALSTKFVRISGESMAPTLSPGQWVRVSRRAYSGDRPARFDVVRLEEPGRAGHWIVKRIVGLPGEEVRLEDGVLIVDGQPVPEPYVNSRASTGRHEWWPRADEYVVLGDNRIASTDSRKFGVVKLDAIMGKVALCSLVSLRWRGFKAVCSLAL